MSFNTFIAQYAHVVLALFVAAVSPVGRTAEDSRWPGHGATASGQCMPAKQKCKARFSINRNRPVGGVDSFSYIFASPAPPRAAAWPANVKTADKWAVMFLPYYQRTKYYITYINFTKHTQMSL